MQKSKKKREIPKSNKKSDKEKKQGEKQEEKQENKIVLDLFGSEILERKAVKFGTGAHILIPKEHIGKKIKIIIEESKEEDKDEKK